MDATRGTSALGPIFAMIRDNRSAGRLAQSEEPLFVAETGEASMIDLISNALKKAGDLKLAQLDSSSSGWTTTHGWLIWASAIDSGVNSAGIRFLARIRIRLVLNQLCVRFFRPFRIQTRFKFILYGITSPVRIQSSLNFTWLLGRV